MPRAPIAQFVPLKKITKRLVLSQLPIFAIPIQADDAKSVPMLDLEVSQCSMCGHLFVNNQPPEIAHQIYGQYYAHYRVDQAEALIPFYREPFSRAIATIVDDQPHRLGKVLEIGCSSGALFPQIAAHCTHYVGVDPSNRIREAKQQFPENTWYQSYFDEQFPEIGFDTVISQFALEHSRSPATDIAAIRRVCSSGGRIILQVPNIDFYLSHGNPNFFAHEHLQYFGVSQLRHLLNRFSMEILYENFDGPSIVIVARESGTNESRLPSSQGQLRDATLEMPSPPIEWLASEPTGIYGVGPLLFRVLPLLMKRAGSAELTVIDDNPAYQNLSVPGYGIPILGNQAIVTKKISTLILTLNTIYHSAVKNRLADLGFRGTVISFQNNAWSRDEF